MSVYWDKRNKRWRYEFTRTIAGQRHRAGRLLPAGWSQAQADAFDRAESGRLYAIAAGIERADPLIDTAVAHYLRDKTHLKSFKGAAENLAAIAWAFAGRPMSELPAVAKEVAEKRVIAAVSKGRGEHTVSVTTVRNRLALLKAACRWAWKQHGLTETDPTARMQIPAAKAGRKVYLQRRGMLQVARAADWMQTRVAIRVAFYSGLRLGELWRIEVVDNLLVLADSKNGDPRVVPAHPRIMVCLQHLPLTMERRTLQADWQRARAKTIGDGVRFHDLRHSTASELINAGVDLHTIGKVLGHKDARSTDRYAHLLGSTLAAAVNKIGQKSPHNDSDPSKKKTA